MKTWFHETQTPDLQGWSVTVKQVTPNYTENISGRFSFGCHTEQRNYWKWPGVVRVLLSSVWCWLDVIWLEACAGTVEEKDETKEAVIDHVYMVCFKGQNIVKGKLFSNI